MIYNIHLYFKCRINNGYMKKTVVVRRALPKERKSKIEKNEILYKWFILNIEHPYPCRQTKKELAARTSMSIDYIDEWFKYQRKKLKNF